MIRILIVDDHELVREGLRSMLKQESDIEIVGEVGDGRLAVRTAEKTVPNIVLMDIMMPGLNGAEATTQIISRVRGLRVLALSMSDDRKTVERLLKAGASGYILKSASYRELISAIRTVADGGFYLSPEITGIVIESVANNANEDRVLFARLTPREREVLQLIAEGSSIKEAAATLCISVQTVHSHRASLLGKMEVESDAELTKLAIREGITSL